MRRPTALLALALLCALVATTSTAGAAFTTRESNSQTVTAGIIEEPIQLVVQSKSADGGTGSNIDYGLRLQNRGTDSIALDRVSLRYWFTTDGGLAAPVAECSYASFGCSRITQRVVKLSVLHQGASHYANIDYVSGSLGPNQSAPLEQLVIRDPYGWDYTETNDHSFRSAATFVDNLQVTAYIDGQLAWGTEPTPTASVESVEVQYANMDPVPDDEAIRFKIDIINTGTRDLAARRVEVRYWFTKDSFSSSLLGFCDYAEAGCGKVIEDFRPVEPPKPNADSHLWITLDATIPAGSRSGMIQMRIHKSDYSPLYEQGDYSHGTNTSYVTTPRITAYIDGRLVWGTPP